MQESTAEHSEKAARYAVGVMSGTSIDGLDAALIRITGTGLAMRVSLLHWLSTPLGDLTPSLRAIANQQRLSAQEIARAAWQLCELHVQLIERLLRGHDARPILIVVHGQTIVHEPPISWQLINDAPIRSRWPNANVISDLRQDDLAQGGQGAPITPLADWVLFRHERYSRAIVNLGGFCNITILPRSAGSPEQQLRGIVGFDLCACNHILDAVARESLGTAYDDGGQSAARGVVNEQAAVELTRILDRQHAEVRSLGTGDEAMEWVSENIQTINPCDLAATAATAIGQVIGHALHPHPVDQIILAGGGAFNAALTHAIQSNVREEVLISDKLNIPVQSRESMAMAILGALHMDGVPITLPQVTGRRESC